MATHSICFTIPVLFAIFLSCVAIGIRRVGYESKYGRVIHEETVGCGSLHEVGPDERFYFNSKLIRSPFDTANKKDIHYLDISRIKTSPLGREYADNFVSEVSADINSGTDTPQSPSAVDGEVDEDRESPEGAIASLATPSPSSTSRQGKLVSSRMGSSSTSYRRSQNPVQKDLHKNPPRKGSQDQKWQSDGRRYNSLGKEIAEEVTTSAPAVVANRKPHWSDRYLGKPIKESAIYDERDERAQFNRPQSRPSPAISGRDRRGFFSSRAHQPSLKRISKRSIFSQPRTETQWGEHETCTWQFTSKPSCKHLVARLTRFKDNEIECENEYLLFKGLYNEMRFCNSKTFYGSFHAKGKTLTVEHKKLLGLPESHFEGFVTCVDQEQNEIQ